MSLSRRGFIVALPFFLAACTSTRKKPVVLNYSPDYAEVPHLEHPLAALDISTLRPELRRQDVEYFTSHANGTIVIDTPNKYLYYIVSNTRALRYGIGVGKEGLTLRGNAYVGRKAEWPGWTPTANMLRRDPETNGPFRGGVPGGLNNPLGARALYLYRGGRDTMFRIHGTNQPETIGLAMSSGCIRMINHDAIDLYNRVPVGAKVVVIQA